MCVHFQRRLCGQTGLVQSQLLLTQQCFAFASRFLPQRRRHHDSGHCRAILTAYYINRRQQVGFLNLIAVSDALDAHISHKAFKGAAGEAKLLTFHCIAQLAGTIDGPVLFPECPSHFSLSEPSFKLSLNLEQALIERKFFRHSGCPHVCDARTELCLN